MELSFEQRQALNELIYDLEDGDVAFVVDAVKPLHKNWVSCEVTYCDLTVVVEQNFPEGCKAQIKGSNLPKIKESDWVIVWPRLVAQLQDAEAIATRNLAIINRFDPQFENRYHARFVVQLSKGVKARLHMGYQENIGTVSDRNTCCLLELFAAGDAWDVLAAAHRVP
jgi:hypothetical protein